MALDVTIVRGATTYRLEVEEGTIEYEKSALSIPIPAGTNPILWDLGQFRVNITLSGKIPETGTTDTDGATIPGKDTLELAARDWWNVITTPITLTLSSINYTVAFARARFSLHSGQQNLWNMILIFTGYRA